MDGTRPQGPANAKASVRDFLMSRRAKITAEDAGMPTHGGRRVSGLRRGEVADLAGISVEYYAKLERGHIGGASAAVLDAVARALRLDDAEYAHFLDLVRTVDGIPTSGRPRGRSRTARQVRPGLHSVVDSMTDAVAFVRNQRQDIVAINALGRAFYSPVIGSGGRTPNLARFQFLDPASVDFYPDWERMARMCVGVMRTEVGRSPHDRDLLNLIGELTAGSEDFARMWADHDVRIHGAGTKRFVHPEVGEIELFFEELDVTADAGLNLYVYSAVPGTADYDKLRLLGSLGLPEATEESRPRQSTMTTTNEQKSE